MPSLVVVGAQWGDEGKGKVVDVLATQADFVVRAQGGHNAGHTVIIEDVEYKLHLIPSGILSPQTQCFIGSGVVLDLKVLCQEIKMLEEKGIQISERLHLSEGAHLILPYHQLIDRLAEERKKKGTIGTTLSGIGPCYADKINRIGIRLGDLRHPQNFSEKLKKNLNDYNTLYKKIYDQAPLDFDAIYTSYLEFFKQLKPYVCPWENWPLHEELKAGKRILLEGAQGSFLDIDWGTYPFVTSSNTVATGICTGAGFGPRAIDHVLGVVKAYTTRVGSGPLPTAFEHVEGFPIQTEARELGTTTGRVRRMGWLDLPQIKQAVELNSMDQLVLTKLDILDQVKTLKYAVGYRFEGKVYHKFPQDSSLMNEVEPIYEEMPGWLCSTSEIRSFEKLPKEAKAYIQKIESFCECPITLISVGPKRSQILKRGFKF